MIIIFIFLIIALILVTIIEIKFVFNYSENSIKFDVYIYKFDLTKFLKNRKKREKHGEEILKNNEEMRKMDFQISLNLFLKILDKMKFLRHKPVFIIDNYLEFGLDEADVTAVLYGYLNNLVYFILKVISSYVNLKNTKVSIVPKYNSIFLKFYFQGILKIRIAQIIYISFLFITLGRKLNGTTSN